MDMCSHRNIRIKQAVFSISPICNRTDLTVHDIDIRKVKNSPFVSVDRCKRGVRDIYDLPEEKRDNRVSPDSSMGMIYRLTSIILSWTRIVAVTLALVYTVRYLRSKNRRVI